jgi:predicted O-linked N-acetylglucosamine transferase (SPINDLY family)
MSTTEDQAKFKEALGFQQRGQWPEAIHIYSELLSLHPHRRSLLINLIKCCESIKDFLGMQTHARTLCDHYPGDVTAVQTFIEVMLLVGNPNAAKECFEQIAEREVREALVTLALKAYLILGDSLSAQNLINEYKGNLENTCLTNYMFGVTYRRIGDLRNAISAYERIEKTSPLYLKARLELTLIRRECGIFEEDDEITNLLSQFGSDPSISAYEAPNPFTVLHFQLPEIGYRKIAEAAEARPTKEKSRNPQKPGLREKIKLAYVSPDFRDHAVGYLIEPVLKSHNREKFYLIGVDLCQSPIEGFRKHILNNFDKVINISELNEEVLDLAIDLAGPTLGSTPGLFERRIAGKQLVWLGYPGTSGRHCYDGIIADKYVIPPTSAHYFTEPVIYMPDCYQPFDGAAAKYFPKHNRKQEFIKFQFASLNNPVKLNAAVLKAWGEILTSCPKSDLNIFVCNKECETQLNRIFNRFGVDSDRLKYMYPVARKEHLDRVRSVDLALDTWPYNGHTTTQDAVMVNVPVLTVKGDAFQARVAESILRNCGLSEFVANDIQNYIGKAVSFYQEVTMCNGRRNILEESLPDIKKFTADLENIYESILDD